MNGAYAIPMKFMRRWRWENIWLIFTILSLWIFPMLTAWIALPHPLLVYAAIPSATLLRMGLIGLLWGFGVMLLGMSFPLVGVAIGASVGLGCAAAMGTLLPVLYGGSSGLTQSVMETIAAGVVTVLLGVAVCGIAGHMRERNQRQGTSASGHSIRGFVFAFVGGSLTASLNLALALGKNISAAVELQHPSSIAAGIAVWIPVLLAGGIPGFVYSLILLSKGRSAPLFREAGTSMYWPLTALMGVLWLGSIVFFGYGAQTSGPLGLIVGWPIFMAGAVIASSAWGALFGEWQNSGAKAQATMVTGILFLTTAIAILGRINH
jgi:L-rhamnose-H+ transport protein